MDLMSSKNIADPYKRYNDLNYAVYGNMDWKYSKTVICKWIAVIPPATKLYVPYPISY